VGIADRVTTLLPTMLNSDVGVVKVQISLEKLNICELIGSVLLEVF